MSLLARPSCCRTMFRPRSSNAAFPTPRGERKVRSSIRLALSGADELLCPGPMALAKLTHEHLPGCRRLGPVKLRRRMLGAKAFDATVQLKNPEMARRDLFGFPVARPGATIPCDCASRLRVREERPAVSAFFKRSALSVGSDQRTGSRRSGGEPFQRAPARVRCRRLVQRTTRASSSVAWSRSGRTVPSPTRTPVPSETCQQFSASRLKWPRHTYPNGAEREKAHRRSSMPSLRAPSTSFVDTSTCTPSSWTMFCLGRMARSGEGRWELESGMTVHVSAISSAS